jgi:hypothetical protein
MGDSFFRSNLLQNMLLLKLLYLLLHQLLRLFCFIVIGFAKFLWHLVEKVLKFSILESVFHYFVGLVLIFSANILLVCHLNITVL